MRRARVAIIAALLALVGCKNTDKAGEDKTPSGIASRLKKDKDKNKDGKDTGKGPSWLEDVQRLPGAGTTIPKGNGAADPTSPNYDPKVASQKALGGRIFSPDEKPASEVYITIKQVNGPANQRPLGIYSKPDGTFYANGFETGQAYEVTAQTTKDGRKFVGSVQTKVPNPVLQITLRDDLPPGDGGTFPPTPKPSDKVGDGSYNPIGNGTGVPPASIGGGTAPKPPASDGTPVPPPSSEDLMIPSPTPVKPENTAEGPKPPGPVSPPVNIPGPGSGPPPVPKLPPVLPGGQSMSNPKPTGKLTLIDTLERSCDLLPTNSGGVVLVEFMSSSCKYCPRVIPILKDLQSRYGANGLQVAGVLCDNTSLKQRIATAEKYTRDYDLNYAMYVEPGETGSVRDRQDLGVNSYPHAVLLDSSGRVLWMGHPGEKKTQLEAAIKQSLGK